MSEPDVTREIVSAPCEPEAVLPAIVRVELEHEGTVWTGTEALPGMLSLRAEYRLAVCRLSRELEEKALGPRLPRGDT